MEKNSAKIFVIALVLVAIAVLLLILFSGNGGLLKGKGTGGSGGTGTGGGQGNGTGNGSGTQAGGASPYTTSYLQGLGIVPSAIAGSGPYQYTDSTGAVWYGSADTLVNMAGG